MSILGVVVTTNNRLLLELNYGDIINKVNATLNVWCTQNLSLIGQVLIVNSLTGSLFTYKMQVLPSIPEPFITKIEALVVDFIWNGKKPKMMLSTMQLNKNQGGLGLINLRLKDESLKINWVKWLNICCNLCPI